MDADGLGGVLVIHRDRDRQRLGVNVAHKAYRRIAVRVVEAMWRSAAIKARPSKRKEKKEQFSSAWVVVFRSFRPSFLKTYTV